MQTFEEKTKAFNKPYRKIAERILRKHGPAMMADINTEGMSSGLTYGPQGVLENLINLLQERV